MSLSATRIGRILLGERSTFMHPNKETFAFLDKLHSMRMGEPTYQKLLDYDPDAYARILSRELSDIMFHTLSWSSAMVVCCACGFAQAPEIAAASIPLGACSAFVSYTSMCTKRVIDETIARYDAAKD